MVGPFVITQQRLWRELRVHEASNVIPAEETLMSSSNCPFDEKNCVDHELLGFGTVVAHLLLWLVQTSKMTSSL